MTTININLYTWTYDRIWKFGNNPLILRSIEHIVISYRYYVKPLRSNIILQYFHIKDKISVLARGYRMNYVDQLSS